MKVRSVMELEGILNRVDRSGASLDDMDKGKEAGAAADAGLERSRSEPTLPPSPPGGRAASGS